MTSKLNLGPINSALLKQKKKREEIGRIRKEYFKDLLDLKTKYNMSKQEFLITVELCFTRIKHTISKR